MDSTLVFFRTAAGEAAVSQPTRIVQRHLRTALMLVDGRRQVAEVVARFGDIAVGEAALSDLLRSGLIEPAELHRQRRTDAASSPSSPLSEPAAASAPVAAVPTQIATAPSPARDDVEPEAKGFPRRPPAPPAARRAVERAPQGAARPAHSRRGAGSEGQRPRGGRASLVLALLLFLGLSVAAGLRFYPYERHLPQLEQRLTAALGQTVAIGSIHPSLWPYPNLTLEDVRVGGATGIAIGALRVVPDASMLWSGRVAVRDLQLERFDVDRGNLPLLADLLAGLSGANGLAVRALRFSDATLHLSDAVLSGIEGAGDVGDAPLVLAIRTGDGALKGEVSAEGSALRVKFGAASGWAPAALGPLAFDSFDAEGTLTPDALRLSKVYARIADGSLSGRAEITFDAGTRISADLDMKHVSLNKLLAFSKTELFAQGSASGLIRVGGSAVAAQAAGGGLVFEGDVTVQHGALQGVDLVEAARSGHRGAVSGGSTRFEEFSGRVKVDGQAWRVTGLRLQSGLMSAQGQIAGGADRKLAGQVSVELRGSAGRLRVPLSVGGSLTNPLLSASRAATAASVPEPS